MRIYHPTSGKLPAVICIKDIEWSCKWRKMGHRIIIRITKTWEKVFINSMRSKVINCITIPTKNCLSQFSQSHHHNWSASLGWSLGQGSHGHKNQDNDLIIVPWDTPQVQFPSYIVVRMGSSRRWHGYDQTLISLLQAISHKLPDHRDDEKGRSRRCIFQPSLSLNGMNLTFAIYSQVKMLQRGIRLINKQGPLRIKEGDLVAVGQDYRGSILHLYIAHFYTVFIHLAVYLVWINHSNRRWMEVV